jgi:hypothetical protein
MAMIYLVRYAKHVRPLDQVEALLLQLEKAYPEEHTYYYRHASLLVEKKEFAKALPLAEKAFARAFAGNKLYTGLKLAQIRKSLDEPTKAKSLLHELLELDVAKSGHNEAVVRSIQANLKELEADSKTKNEAPKG